MKYLLMLLLLSSSLADAANTKFLQYRYNDAVTLVISATACSFPQIKDEYPFAAAAFRVDGQKLAGCFKKYNEDLIEIQWYKGDKTVLPANAFLVKPVEAQSAPDM
jgi:hypothetical protein